MRSLAFRKNLVDIYKGVIPKKYTTILPYVKGNDVLEVGTAEGVLSLLLSEKKNKVLGVEKQKNRYEEALKLQQVWKSLGKKVDNCSFVNLDFIDHLDLLENIDTFVAIRTIYYFRENLDKIFLNISKRCRYVVLGGNSNRATKYKENKCINDVGEWNYYASSSGMINILKKYDYEIEHVIIEKPKVDPLVVGIKSKQEILHKLDHRVRKSIAHHLIKKDMIKSPEQIKISILGETFLDVDCVLEKSREILDKTHVGLLEEYKEKGRKFNYKDSEYWKRLCKNRIEGITKRGDPPAFFGLYEKIKVEGFKKDVRNPIIMCDLEKSGINLGWKWHRANGAHRAAIAKVLGYKKIPVLIVELSLKLLM